MFLAILGAIGIGINIFSALGQMGRQAKADALQEEARKQDLSDKLAQTRVSMRQERDTMMRTTNLLNLFAQTDEGQSGRFGDIASTDQFAQAGDPSDPMVAEFQQIYGQYDVQNVMAGATGRTGSASMVQQQSLDKFKTDLGLTKYELDEVHVKAYQDLLSGEALLEKQLAPPVPIVRQATAGAAPSKHRELVDPREPAPGRRRVGQIGADGEMIRPSKVATRINTQSANRRRQTGRTTRPGIDQ